MRVLLDDIIPLALITATSQSVNYPVINLIHPFLKKRYQNTTGGATLLFNFTIPQPVNCFFIGYNNIDTLQIKINGVIVVTQSDVNPDIGILYLDSTYSATLIEISFFGFYIGKISAGVYTQFPDLVAQYDTGQVDNSSFFESPDGQTLVNEIEPLRVLTYSVRELIDNSFIKKYRAKPLFIDLYEFAPWKEAPIYGRFTSPFGLKYNPRRYDTTFSIKECR